MGFDMLTMLWPWALLLVAFYCLVQFVRDWRAGNYLMAAAGLICLVLLVFIPIQPDVVKMDVLAGH